MEVRLRLILNDTYNCTILREGYSENIRCGSAGKHTTSSVNVQIRPFLGDVNIANYLLSYQESFVPAVIKDEDETVLFTGVIRPYITHTSNCAHSGNLSLEVMDYTETLHEYIWPASTEGTIDGRIYTTVYSDINLSDLLQTLFSLKGRTFTPYNTSETIHYLKLPTEEYLDDVIAEILYEYGLDYRWTATGEAEAFCTFVDDADEVGTLSDVITELRTTRSDDTSDGLEIRWKEFCYYPNVKIYTFDSGNMTGHSSDWNAWVLSNYHNLTGKLWSGRMHDTWNNPDETMPDGNLWSWYLPASGIKKSDGSYIGSSDLLWLRTAADRIKVELLDEEGVTYSVQLESYDVNGIRMWVDYSGDFDVLLGTGWTWRITVYGDIAVGLDSEASYNVTGADPESISLKYRLTLPNDRETITADFAKKFSARQKYSKLQYSFKSASSFGVGGFYTLTDSVSGRTMKLRLLSRIKDEDGIYSYTAEGVSTIEDAAISVIDSARSYSKYVQQGKTPYERAVEDGFRGTEQEWIASLSAWDVTWAPAVYKIHPREGGSGEIIGHVNRNGATGKISCGVVENSFDASIDPDTEAITILYTEELSTSTTCTITVTIGSKSKEYCLSGVFEDADPKYFGARDSAPTGENYIEGDWYVDGSSNVMYVYKSGEWTAYANADSFSGYPLDKVSIALADMISIGTTDKTTATLLGVFKALCADKGFIKFLSVLNLMITNATGMSVAIQSTDSDGVPLTKPVFKISYNGDTVFQVDPASGNVFMGNPNSDLSAPETGFMYRASDGNLLSKDGNIQIDGNGNISITGSGSFDSAVIRSGIFTGNLSGASGTFNGQFDTPALKSVANSSSSTTISQSVSAMSGSDGEKTRYQEFVAFAGKCPYLPIEVTASTYSGGLVFNTCYQGYALYDTAGNEVAFAASNGKYYDSRGLESAFTLSATYGGGDKLFLKDIQLGSNGLESGQVYRDSDGFLKIVT